MDKYILSVRHIYNYHVLIVSNERHQSRKRVEYAFSRVFIILSVFKMAFLCLVLLILAAEGHFIGMIPVATFVASINQKTPLFLCQKTSQTTLIQILCIILEYGEQMPESGTSHRSRTFEYALEYLLLNFGALNTSTERIFHHIRTYSV
jgi:hypothetical protein